MLFVNLFGGSETDVESVEKVLLDGLKVVGFKVTNKRSPEERNYDAVIVTRPFLQALTDNNSKLSERWSVHLFELFNLGNINYNILLLRDTPVNSTLTESERKEVQQEEYRLNHLVKYDFTTHTCNSQMILNLVTKRLSK